MFITFAIAKQNDMRSRMLCLESFEKAAYAHIV